MVGTETGWVADRKREREGGGRRETERGLFVGWFLNVPATG